VQLNLHWIDLAIIGAYFVGVLGLGLWLARRDQGDADDYFVAGRRLGWFAVGASLFASNISSEHLIGLSADGFRSGLAVGNYEWGAAIVLLILAVVFVPFYIGSRIRTMPEFLERRFGVGARVYLSLITIAANVLVRISVALYAGAVVMQEMFGVGMWTSIAILAVTTVIYTAAGGLKAVVYTDAVQAVVLLVGTILLTAIALSRVGGWDGLMSHVDADSLDMIRPADDPQMPWVGLLLGVPILGIWYWCTDQVIVQRVLGARDVNQARMGAVFAAFLKILPVFLFVLPGLCGRILYPEIAAEDAESVFPTMLRDLLPVGITGLVAAGLIAALMSSIDSTLNSTGTLVSLDFYQRWRPGASQKSIVSVGRITTVVVMAFGMAWVLVVERAESLFQYLQEVNAAISPPIAAAFLVGVFWKRANHTGVMTALVGGLGVGLVLLVLEPFPFLISAAVTFAISVALLAIGSLTTAPPRPEQVEGLTWGGVGALVGKLTTASQRRRFRVLVGVILVVMAALWGATADPGCWKPPLKEPSAGPTPIAAAPEGDVLRFSIREGSIDNHFVRRGPAAGHLLLRSGAAPRIIAAFPAGNSGVAVWFAETRTPVSFAVDGQVDPVSDGDHHGVAATVIARGAARLEITRPVLGSVRVIRDVMHGQPLPDGFRIDREVVDSGLTLSRRSMAGRGYRLRLEPLGDTRIEEGGEALATSGEALRFRMVATTDEPPLTPIPMGRLLDAGAADEPAMRQALTFLSYEEKLLAGSWRFLTYFGRDTLLSTRLLAPALQPEAIEAGLGSVLERLSPDGAVAHEEDIGEFPGLRGEQAPAYDYKMIDDDFMLAPIVAYYLLETEAGTARRAGFLDRHRDALKRNLALVLERARPYAGDPKVANLIHTRDDLPVGNWRDSQEGLGYGRIPYDVNAILVPAALASAARLYQLDRLADPERAAEAKKLAEVWAGAADHFRVELTAADARARVERHAGEVGVPAGPALAALGDQPVTFGAVALDAAGEPIPILHTDDGFALLFLEPPAEELRRIAAHVERPFPAGLWTPVGVVVANPAYADDARMRELFSREHYHGSVVWSWQQALLASGLARQLARGDLDSDTRAALERSRAALWRAIDAARDVKTSELWSWDHDPGSGWEVVPFGQGSGHLSESNAAQLWSTVYLAIPRP
jgi:SSS family transporter